MSFVDKAKQRKHIENEWRFKNRIIAIVTCWRNVCDVRVLHIRPGDALLMLSAISRG